MFTVVPTPEIRREIVGYANNILIGGLRGRLGAVLAE